MQLDITLSRVITTCTDLIREVETMGLLLGPEQADEVDAGLPQQEVARVTQVASVHFGLLKVE